MHEYYNECNDLKIVIDDNLNTLKLTYVSTGDFEVYNITANWTTILLNALQVPGFEWGDVMMNICRAVANKISGGSSAS